MSSPFTLAPEGVRVAVRVTPRAGINALAGVSDGRLLVKVTASPHDGEANAAVVKLLAKACGVPASRIELLGGATARIKLFLLRGATLAELPKF